MLGNWDALQHPPDGCSRQLLSMACYTANVPQAVGIMSDVSTVQQEKVCVYDLPMDQAKVQICSC